MYAKWAVIDDLSVKKHEPFKLCNIAAARTINLLKNIEYHELLRIFNSVKNKLIYIRAGQNNERKLYSFSNIVKNFMYKKKIDPLVTLEYFDNVIVNPTPFCIHCGLFKKIEESLCCCKLCNFLRFACVFTAKIERPYHTK